MRSRHSPARTPWWRIANVPTNIGVIEKFVPVKFTIRKEKRGVHIIECLGA
jgi:hypothetical protein